MDGLMALMDVSVSVSVSIMVGGGAERERRGSKAAGGPAGLLVN